MNETIRVHAYTESGDFVKCNNCDIYLLLPFGADKCPQCQKSGCLSWNDESLQEANYDELIKRRYNISSHRALLPEQYLSEEILK